MKRPQYSLLNRFTVLVSVFLISNILFAQSVWKNFTESNSGLPGMTIREIDIDEDGHLWICSFSGGIAQYDGIDWKVFNKENSGLPNNFVNTIEIDNNGKKWIGTDGGGLSTFDGENWKNYNNKNSDLPSNVIMDILCDDDNNIWVATYFGGLAKFDGTNWKTYTTENSDIPTNKIVALAADQYNTLWLGTHGGGLASFDGTNWAIYNSENSALPNDFVYSVAVDDDDACWIGTGGGGVAVFDRVEWTVYNDENSSIPDNNIRPLIISQKGHKWIGTYFGGIAAYTGEKWQLYNINNSILPDDEITTIAEGINGIKWFGTERSGIFQFADTIEREIEKPIAKQIIHDTRRPAIPDKDAEHKGFQNNYVFLVNAESMKRTPQKMRLFIKTFKKMVKSEEFDEETFQVNIITYKPKGEEEVNNVLAEKYKKALEAAPVVKMDEIAPFNHGLMKAYDITRANDLPGANNKIYLATDEMIVENEDEIRQTIQRNFNENNISFSVLSLGNTSQVEQRRLRNLVPQGGGAFLHIEPVRFIDNWSATVHVGSTIFRGDLDRTKLVNLPGEIGFALNKKVISSGLINGGIKTQFNWGKLQGEKNNYSFENKYFEGCLNFQLIMNRWFNRNFKYETFRPYGFAGIGFIRYRVLEYGPEGNVVNGYGYSFDNENIPPGLNDPDKASPEVEMIFPVGAGVNYALNSDIDLEMEVSSRYINSDKLDGRVAQKDDKYLFFSIGCTYKFPQREFLSNVLYTR